MTDFHFVVSPGQRSKHQRSSFGIGLVSEQGRHSLAAAAARPVTLQDVRRAFGADRFHVNVANLGRSRLTIEMAVACHAFHVGKVCLLCHFRSGNAWRIHVGVVVAVPSKHALSGDRTVGVAPIGRSKPATGQTLHEARDCWCADADDGQIAFNGRPQSDVMIGPGHVHPPVCVCHVRNPDDGCNRDHQSHEEQCVHPEFLLRCNVELEQTVDGQQEDDEIVEDVQRAKRVEQGIGVNA